MPSAGSGSVHSFVVMHHPPMPGYDFPVAIGARSTSTRARASSRNIVDCPFDEIHIGMKVEASIEEIGRREDAGLPARGGAAMSTGRRISQVAVGDELPALDVPLTAAIIVGGALASRDYTPVHHDRSAAQRVGHVATCS